ncbi:Phosphoserine phosphatase RsbU [Planctomycetes bacterium Pan216]|uniref:Phosphoserine phosphatase RsbU n=1 Tax=Kolteria novifilia TaxID=2527975 RepID=A0A518B1U9_9BACT|nr:Phosphoserine phosphatase RsbU [Planctomycetes bacterium Pan216]
MNASIHLLNGNNAGQRVELTTETVRMGRHPDCEVVIDASSVSRFHARLIRDGDQYLIEDLKSRNGTYVNGQRVEGTVPLRDNDRVKICETLLVYNGIGSTSPSTGIPQRPEESDLQVEESEDNASATVLTSLDARRSSESFASVNPEAKLRAMIEISQAIGQTLELDALFPKILDSLFGIFPHADRAMLLIRDGNGRLIPRAVKHRRESEDTVRYSRTIVEAALDERKAILSADAASDERFAMSQSIAEFRIRSVMCAPLLAQDQDALGVIQIDTQSTHERFEEDDLQILVSVASQAAVSLLNAQMHEDVLRQQRTEQELAFARRVQTAFLPQEMPELDGYSFWAYYEAAGQVGGDYYDFVKLSNGNQAVILGDVSGKGVPAALMMSKVTSDTKVSLLSLADNPPEAMGRINNAICSAGLDDRFITMAICVIDPTTHKITMVNAGHMSPMILKLDGSVAEPAGDDIAGLPAGVMDDFDYESTEVVLEPGETVVLFSDGVDEAMNSKNEQYGLVRLREVVASGPRVPGELGPHILADVQKHVAGYKQSDDMTMVAFGRNAN